MVTLDERLSFLRFLVGVLSGATLAKAQPLLQTLRNRTKTIQAISLRMVAHYAMGSDYVAKASTMFCLEATVGIACVLFQLPGFAN